MTRRDLPLALAGGALWAQRPLRTGAQTGYGGSASDTNPPRALPPVRVDREQILRQKQAANRKDFDELERLLAQLRTHLDPPSSSAPREAARVARLARRIRSRTERG